MSSTITLAQLLSIYNSTKDTISIINTNTREVIDMGTCYSLSKYSKYLQDKVTGFTTENNNLIIGVGVREQTGREHYRITVHEFFLNFIMKNKSRFTTAIIFNMNNDILATFPVMNITKVGNTIENTFLMNKTIIDVKFTESEVYGLYNIIIHVE